jgi:hypothetical protein
MTAQVSNKAILLTPAILRRISGRERQCEGDTREADARGIVVTEKMHSRLLANWRRHRLCGTPSGSRTQTPALILLRGLACL